MSYKHVGTAGDNVRFGCSFQLPKLHLRPSRRILADGSHEGGLMKLVTLAALGSLACLAAASASAAPQKVHSTFSAHPKRTRSPAVPTCL